MKLKSMAVITKLIVMKLKTSYQTAAVPKFSRCEKRTCLNWSIALLSIGIQQNSENWESYKKDQRIEGSCFILINLQLKVILCTQFTLVVRPSWSVLLRWSRFPANTASWTKSCSRLTIKGTLQIFFSVGFIIMICCNFKTKCLIWSVLGEA